VDFHTPPDAFPDADVLVSIIDSFLFPIPIPILLISNRFRHSQSQQASQ